jgi:SAM-dependent methyltransferase
MRSVMQASELIGCPGCGSEGALATGSLAPVISQNQGGVEFVQPPYKVLECFRCGLLFKTPVPSAEALTENYSFAKPDRYEYGDPMPTEQLLLHHLQDLPDGSRVLDFGCSTGRLLTFLPRRYESFGCEINDDAAGWARQRGVTMIPVEGLFDGTTPAFDAIILSDVVEHLDRPTDVLLALWRLLSPGGTMLLSTGNGDHWACRIDPALFWYFRSYEHLSMVTRRYAEHIGNLLEATIPIWDRACHFNVGRMMTWKIHVAHAVFWMHAKGPYWLKQLTRSVPGFRNLTGAPCPPTYAVCRDHLVIGLRKRPAPLTAT